jgi:WD40 repeat protein
VTGALTSRADRLYTAADPEGRRAIEQVFLRLVTLGEGREDTRRRVVLGELDALDVSEVAVGAALDAYGLHRLLTFDHEPATREPTVEIAHESLLGAWGRLSAWIGAAREDLRQNERVSRAAAEWRGSGRDPSFLMSGSRLDQVEGWMSATRLSVGRHERAYLKASIEHRDRARRKEKERRDHEAALERRSVRRLRGLVAVFAVAALVAGSLTIVATNQGGRAEREARIASARELAAAAVANIENDQQLSVLLAIEAVERTRSEDGTVLREAEEALHRAVTASRIVTSIPGSSEWEPGSGEWGDLGGGIDWGPAGLVVAHGVFSSEGPRPAGVVDLRDEETGAIARSLPGHDGAVTGAAFSLDGSMLATTGEDGLLKVWDLSSGDVISTIRGPASARGPSFSADGSRVAAAFAPLDTPDGVVRVLDLRSDTVTTFPSAPYVNDVSISPDGSRVVSVGGFQGRADLLVVDVETAKVQRIPNDQGLLSVAWSPDGRFIAAGGFGSSVLVVDAEGRFEFELRGHSGGAYWVDWSPDGTQLVTGSADGTAKIWEITERGGTELMTLTARAGTITGVAYSPDGTRVLTRSETRVMDVWGVGPRDDAEVANVADAERIVSLTSGSLVTSGRDGSLMTLDLGTGERTHGPIGLLEPRRILVDGQSLHVADWSPDGAFAAVLRGRSMEIVDGSGRRVGRLPADGFMIGIGGLRFGPDGLIAFATYGDELHNDVKIWDWTRDEIVAEIPILPGFDVFEVMGFDAEGRRIAIGGHDTTIWDVRTGRLMRTLRSSEVLPTDLAFSPDGARLAEIDRDGTLRVFDTASGEEVLVLRGHEGGGQVMFSPDGSMLATVGGDLARVWALDVDDLLEIARKEVTRSLTDEECRQYLHVGSCREP